LGWQERNADQYREWSLYLKRAAITMVFNESIFLPIWLDHYGAQFGLKNLFIIDDGSIDGSTSDSRIVNLVKKDRTLFDEHDRSSLVSSFHRRLLSYYDVVIYTDVDELIVIDPLVGMSLREYLSSDVFEHKNVIGLNILQEIGREHPIDLNQPLLEQRKFAQFHLIYCKPAISKVPMIWGPGFHHARQRDPLYDPNLFLFHLRAIDVALAKERHRAHNPLVFSANAFFQEHSPQFGWSEEKYLQAFFPRSACDFEGAQTFTFDSIKPLITARVANQMPIFRIPERFTGSVKCNVVADEPSGGRCQTENPPNQKTIADLFSDCLIEMIKTNPFRGRNEPCPCGSGRKYKHCHGTLS
jgi:hypothetical protein